MAQLARSTSISAALFSETARIAMVSSQFQERHAPA